MTEKSEFDSHEVFCAGLMQLAEHLCAKACRWTKEEQEEWREVVTHGLHNDESVKGFEFWVKLLMGTQVFLRHANMFGYFTLLPQRNHTLNRWII